MKPLKKVLYLLLIVFSIPNSVDAEPIEVGQKAVIEIEDDFSIGESINRMNRERFSDIYKSEVILPLIYGEPIKTPKIGRVLTMNNFFRSPYCFQLGEFSHSGSVNKPTWCNRKNGPFSK